MQPLFPYSAQWLNYAIAGLTFLGMLVLLFPRVAHAEMVMGIEMSPAVCRMHPNYLSLRQCADNRVVNVSYFSTGLQGRCSSQIKLALPPLQEKVVSRVIADPYMQQQLWQSYGVCSGMTAQSYFRQITSFFNAIKLPDELRTTGRIRVNRNSLLQQINRENPTISPQSVNLFCQVGADRSTILTHINICYTAMGSYTRCTSIRPSNCPRTFYIDGR